MLTDKRREEIRQLFVREVEGGVSKYSSQIFDELVGEEYIYEEEFVVNEMEICGIFDDSFFTCVKCDWTQPNENTCSGDVDELICSDCYCEDDNEDED